MKLQRFLSLTRKAIDEYNMIEDGDKIAIGVSGGKDSLCLIRFLKELQRFYPKKFEIVAVTVALGFDNFDLKGIAKYCEDLGVEYHIVETEIGKVVFEERKEKNPCSLCAKMRKGAFNDFVTSIGCNKVALGHHKDDVLETFLMSLFYEGRINTFAPVMYLDRMDLTTIRPMIYIEENDIIGFSKKENLPILKSPCPANGETKREESKEFLAELRDKYEHLDAKLMGAITRNKINNWK
ncbi:MAG: tRNA 2-thiocytidine(32) synthetase TtcA [Clostridia bacterium]|jgi:tRNA(Ile)-lysidine synthase TilS/MesJ|nr:tRNA 2-thiocytidine(32) synthetase TtcA [Clostridia bacterium]